ncbi:hypothetical protein D3273_16830 [Lichenibacterium minor]|uniref:DM2 domain-containing protein n=1 Tax=Lichenibacterium minor TaxID=2316528 RepID=A0A4Q2U6Y8_9HYPH|nr:SWIB/MDM2 domain-containing protein [Lichenibacterium minor]RYC30851.1 hypothetical protein D3273_16830 [Lichenibacterium minor]
MTNSSEDALTKARQAGAPAWPPMPSAEFAAIVGDKPLAQTQLFKLVWDYIKANGCQDPADKREIVAADSLRAVFGQD